MWNPLITLLSTYITLTYILSMEVKMQKQTLNNINFRTNATFESEEKEEVNA